MNVLAPITQDGDIVSKAYVDKAIADLNLSEYAKAATTVAFDTLMDDAEVAYHRHIGYGYASGGWYGSGPAIGFGANGTHYAMIQALNDIATPQLFFKSVSGGDTSGEWFQFLFSKGNLNIESDWFSSKGDVVLHRNEDAGDTYINYGPYANYQASVHIYGKIVDFIVNDNVLISGSEVIHAGNIANFTAGKATQLATSRKIWGQNFNGTADVSGNLENVGKIVHSYANAYNMDEYGNFYSSATSDSSYWNFKRSDGNPALAVFAVSGLVQTYYDTTLARYGGTVLIGGNAYNQVAATVYGTLTVTGATSLNNTLSVDGLATFKSEVRSYNQLAILTTDGMDYAARLVPIIDGAQLQVGWQDASSNKGKFYFTGMYGEDLELFNVRSQYSYFDGETVVFRNTKQTLFNTRIYLNNNGIRDCEEIYGAFPTGGTYSRWRAYANSGGFFFEAATYDGLATNGTIGFRGYGGARAEYVKFYANNIDLDGATAVKNVLTVSSHIKTEGQIVGITATGTYERFRIMQNVVGTFFQAGLNDGSAQQGTMYLSGIDNTMMTALHVRADKTTIYGSLDVPYAPATMAGVKIASGQSLSFLDSAGNEHKITFDETNNAFKIDGNLYTTGENSAGGAGNEIQ